LPEESLLRDASSASDSGSSATGEDVDPVLLARCREVVATLGLETRLIRILSHNRKELNKRQDLATRAKNIRKKEGPDILTALIAMKWKRTVQRRLWGMADVLKPGESPFTFEMLHLARMKAPGLARREGLRSGSGAAPGPLPGLTGPLPGLAGPLPTALHQLWLPLSPTQVAAHALAENAPSTLPSPVVLPPSDPNAPGRAIAGGTLPGLASMCDNHSLHQIMAECALPARASDAPALASPLASTSAAAAAAEAAAAAAAAGFGEFPQASTDLSESPRQRLARLLEERENQARELEMRRRQKELTKDQK